jgi:hypothetical protein
VPRSRKSFAQSNTTVSGESNVSAVACLGWHVSRCFDRARATQEANQIKTLPTLLFPEGREPEQREARPPGDATERTLRSPDTVVESLSVQVICNGKWSVEAGPEK